MPRAKRHRLAGQVWHITQRCHRQQFLLKFARDRGAGGLVCRQERRGAAYTRTPKGLQRGGGPT